MNRDEQLYSKLFGPMHSHVYPLTLEQFKDAFGVTEIDPGWLNVAVCVSPASSQRPSWLYVTSGLSDVYRSRLVDTHDPSNGATELLLEAAVRSDWAIVLLQRLAIYQLLLGIDRFPGQPLLTYWHTVQPGGPIDGGASSLTKLLLTPSIHFSDLYETSTGTLTFVQVVGLTASEFDFGKEQGFPHLFDKLKSAGVVPTIDVYRQPVL